MKTFIILLMIGLSLGRAVICQFTSDTYFLNGYGNNMYGTKTAYFWKYPMRAQARNNLMNIQFEGKNCTAIHVNVVSRHGARYVSLGDMRAFTTLQNKLKAELGNQSYAIINNWVNVYPEAKADLLTAMGEREMDFLGYTHGFQLRELLTKAGDGSALNNAGIKFAATRKTRTQESAHAFQNGLTEGIFDKNGTSVPTVIRDKVLRFYDNCKAYDEVTSSNPELSKFQNGPEMQMVRDEITAKLQLASTLTVDDVKLLLRLCALELAVMDNAEWCKLMTDQHRDVLEYENDLEDYYDRLYGHPVTAKMACPLVKDVFTEMDAAIAGHDSGNNYTYGMFQFGHSDTVIEFAANLGFFNDNTTFKADNFQQLQNRTFKNAEVDPFSTHFTFVLYNCDEAGPQNYALRVLFNGRPLPFPVCNSDICRYDTIRENYKHSIEQCDWAGVCHVDESGIAVGR